MNYREAENYIEYLGTLGSKPGLDRIKMLCKQLGNPQNDLKFIHVAGTNGKGSVCTYISNILHQAGIKTGKFTSPAVVEYRERYWISGRMASQAAICRNLEIIKTTIDNMMAEGLESPTQFEVETALSFLLFKEAGCQIVVLECGMGGEADATNIIDVPLVSVITSVSMDHMAFLGKNLEAIAKNKAGIIKHSGHAVTISQSPEVINMIKAKASLERADLTIADSAQAKNVRLGLKTSSFDYNKLKGLKISIPGACQIDNAILAITAIDALRKEKIKIAEDAIRSGLLASSWPCRFDIIAKNPTVILDGAHNPGAAIRLSESIEYYLHNEEENGKIIYIFGMFADKDVDKVCEIMAHHAAHIITVTPPNPRALPATELAAVVNKYHKMVSASSSLMEALEMAYLLAEKDSVIIAFGSLSFLGEIRSLVDSRGMNLRKKETRI